jgi:hypothetical protein
VYREKSKDWRESRKDRTGIFMIDRKYVTTGMPCTRRVLYEKIKTKHFE